MGHPVVFLCPDTGLKVQHWLETPADDTRQPTYVSVACAACTNVHFINSTSCKVLGDDKR
ncbi:MAG: hypothetical protein AB1586_06770 [Pseudomonadota bacterium]|jgi:hypothetical protein